jgi:hypothetical protein
MKEPRGEKDRIKAIWRDSPEGGGSPRATARFGARCLRAGEIPSKMFRLAGGCFEISADVMATSVVRANLQQMEDELMRWRDRGPRSRKKGPFSRARKTDVLRRAEDCRKCLPSSSVSSGRYSRRIARHLTRGKWLPPTTSRRRQRSRRPRRPSGYGCSLPFLQERSSPRLSSSSARRTQRGRLCPWSEQGGRAHYETR